jgi:dihydrolipoamide dehydrogenase
VAATYDVVILGGGTGGYVSAIRASQLGMNVAIVEKDKLGGTCLHRGCIPSKSLLRSAEVYSHAKKMESFGVEVSNVTLNFQKVQERKQTIVDQLYRGVQYLMQKGKIHVFEGHGEITDAFTTSINLAEVTISTKAREKQVVTAKHVIIATGSAPRDIPGFAIDGKATLTSDHALQLEKLPSSIVIVGGGVIGIEWASMLLDFGVKVSVVESLDRILPQEDPDISKEMQKILKKKGLKIYTSAKVQDVVTVSDGVQVSIEVKGKVKEFEAEKLLLSVGRKANIESIGLENTSIVVENHVIRTNEYYQTSIPHIYAIGDVIGGLQLAHVASHEGIIAVEHIAGRNPSPMNYQGVPKCVYSHPQTASVGLTEQEAQKQGFTVKVGKFPFTAIGKALVYGEAEGFAKIIFDEQTKQLLGVHMVGPNVTDLISEAGLATFLETTQMNFAHAIRPHPSLSEIFTESALDAEDVPIHM